jgi:putative toxin-antitoxin system antitoxin component (TIGR02293 family)
MNILRQIEAGVSSEQVRDFQQKFSLPAQDMAFLMTLSRKGYYNLLEQEKLGRHQTERFLRIQQVYEQALETLESVENIHRWMHTYHAYLQRVPYEVLDTFAGCREVEAELIRLDHGVLS